MKKISFPKEPLCEVCGSEPATAFSRIGRMAEATWKFCGACTTESEDYYIEFDRFFGRPAQVVDWLAHLHEKPQTDWKDFMAMMRRFRKATDSFGQLQG